MDEETLERVRAVIAAIPPGSVLAYGDVAARAGLGKATEDPLAGLSAGGAA